MTLEEKIEAELKSAQKSGEGEKVETLRLLRAALHNRSIEKRSKGGEEKLSEEEALEVLSREAKKRREAIELFAKGNREDLKTKEEKELAIISVYLPKQMDREEIVAVINKLHSEGFKDFNSLMREVMKVLKGKADGKLVGDLVKEVLS